MKKKGEIKSPGKKPGRKSGLSFFTFHLHRVAVVCKVPLNFLSTHIFNNNQILRSRFLQCCSLINYHGQKSSKLSNLPVVTQNSNKIIFSDTLKMQSSSSQCILLCCSISATEQVVSSLANQRTGLMIEFQQIYTKSKYLTCILYRGPVLGGCRFHILLH